MSYESGSAERRRADSGTAADTDADLEHCGKKIKEIIFGAVRVSRLRNPRLSWGVCWETIESWGETRPQAAALLKLTKSNGFNLLADGDKQIIWNGYFDRGSESLLATNAPFAYDFVAALGALLRKIPENSFTNLHREY